MLWPAMNVTSLCCHQFGMAMKSIIELNQILGDFVGLSLFSIFYISTYILCLLWATKLPCHSKYQVLSLPRKEWRYFYCFIFHLVYSTGITIVAAIMLYSLQNN